MFRRRAQDELEPNMVRLWSLSILSRSFPFMIQLFSHLSEKPFSIQVLKRVERYNALINGNIKIFSI
jgi:hypothetical protein